MVVISLCQNSLPASGKLQVEMESRMQELLRELAVVCELPSRVIELLKSRLNDYAMVLKIGCTPGRKKS
jgi:hypothetical protein